MVETINPYANSFVHGAKKTGTFIGGTWSGDFGDDIAKKLAGELEFTQNGTKFFSGKTWRTAGENLGKFTAIKDTSLYKDPIGTVRTAYTTVNSAEHAAAKAAVKAADKAAREAAKASGTGFFGKMFSAVGKVLDPIVKPVANLVSQIPGVTSACNAVGKLGKYCKLPVIGPLLMTVGEIPNVIQAFAEGGLGEGCKQLVRSTGSIIVSGAAFAAGSAIGATTAGIIGQILCPIPGLGFILGAAAGMGLAYLADKATKPLFDGVMGKSFAEKQETKERRMIAQNNKPFMDFGGSSLNSPEAMAFLKV